ncbi:ribosomal L37ae protein family-domain-containing protein [Immersiella caudata]|uniref:Ribosomal L37ae protein family-domain-containing protein n=1 Tax=Immersiella caudata TaxID=314043 RepID=A0AA39WEW7_9PEZI|nr:ribosomal L37ae protein family-domain-containing protein [Immersiella caudata]
MEHLDDRRNVALWKGLSSSFPEEVGIAGKYGVRYGSSLRKQMRRLETPQHARYPCTFCGKKSVKRVSVGIWKCHRCKKTMTGGAYHLSTPTATSVKATIRRLRETAATSS